MSRLSSIVTDPSERLGFVFPLETDNLINEERRRALLGVPLISLQFT